MTSFHIAFEGAEVSDVSSKILYVSHSAVYALLHQKVYPPITLPALVRRHIERNPSDCPRLAASVSEALDGVEVPAASSEMPAHVILRLESTLSWVPS
jgi:hypothetical protein